MLKHICTQDIARSRGYVYREQMDCAIIISTPVASVSFVSFLCNMRKNEMRQKVGLRPYLFLRALCVCMYRVIFAFLFSKMLGPRNLLIRLSIHAIVVRVNCLTNIVYHSHQSVHSTLYPQLFHKLIINLGFVRITQGSRNWDDSESKHCRHLRRVLFYCQIIST